MDELDLNVLKEGLPGVSKTRGAEHAEACLVCFGLHKHPIGVELEVKGSYDERFRVVWDDVLTEQIRRAWNDVDDATESGANGIAFLLILALTEYTIIERSRKGTGFDYALGYKDRVPFQNEARLEVSGIFNATSEHDIMRRVEQKLEQTNRSDGELPAYIIVVEFSNPLAYMVKK
jgi:hypothetical protein